MPKSDPSHLRGEIICCSTSSVISIPLPNCGIPHDPFAREWYPPILYDKLIFLLFIQNPSRVCILLFRKHRPPEVYPGRNTTLIWLSNSQSHCDGQLLEIKLKKLKDYSQFGVATEDGKHVATMHPPVPESGCYMVVDGIQTVSYTHLTLPTKRIV